SPVDVGGMANSSRSHHVRRSLAALLAVLLVAMLAPSPAVANVAASGASRFGDVAATSPHAEAIQRMAAAKITLGCAPARFCPNDGLSRGQMASLMARTLGAAPVEQGPFRDVAAASTHAGSINALAEQGIL